jgi:hypothetical protein
VFHLRQYATEGSWTDSRLLADFYAELPEIVALGVDDTTEHLQRIGPQSSFNQACATVKPKKGIRSMHRNLWYGPQKIVNSLNSSRVRSHGPCQVLTYSYQAGSRQRGAQRTAKESLLNVANRRSALRSTAAQSPKTLALVSGGIDNERSTINNER